MTQTFKSCHVRSLHGVQYVRYMVSSTCNYIVKYFIKTGLINSIKVLKVTQNNLFANLA